MKEWQDTNTFSILFDNNSSQYYDLVPYVSAITKDDSWEQIQQDFKTEYGDSSILGGASIGEGECMVTSLHIYTTKKRKLIPIQPNQPPTPPTS